MKRSPPIIGKNFQQERQDRPLSAKAGCHFTSRRDLNLVRRLHEEGMIGTGIGLLGIAQALRLLIWIYGADSGDFR
jgi:hypothetical protein